MVKYRFFLNPLKSLAPFLNSVADKGYRLTKILGHRYYFEKDNNKYTYSTQFVGFDPNEEVIKYIKFIEENGFKTFRAPTITNIYNYSENRPRNLNIEKVNEERLKNKYNTYNNEILIVETKGEEPVKLIKSNVDLIRYFKIVKRVYFIPIIILLAILLCIYIRVINSEFSVWCFLGIFLSVIGILYFQIQYLDAYNTEKYYFDEAKYTEEVFTVDEKKQ